VEKCIRTEIGTGGRSLEVCTEFLDSENGTESLHRVTLLIGGYTYGFFINLGFC
jgi:hypothetical protein